MLVKLYIYGFSKVTGDPHASAFYHPDFVRGKISSCLSLKRNQSTDRRLKKQDRKLLPGSERDENDVLSFKRARNMHDYESQGIEFITSLSSDRGDDVPEANPDRFDDISLFDMEPRPIEEMMRR